MPSVPHFAPSTRGLPFVNGWPSMPLFNINVGPASIPIGDASNGLCGGMVFTVRDYFQAGAPIPCTPPTSGSVFYNYIVKRLFDSFSLPFGPLRYLELMNPALPDHETWASNNGLAPHGRAWVMVKDEWPQIKADIDAGVLSCLGLIELKSSDPTMVGKNHQVMAYRYELSGSNDLQIYVYDPNDPGNDGMIISLNIGDPQHTTTVNYTGTVYDRLYCFFRVQYSPSSPPALPPPRSLDGTLVKELDLPAVYVIYGNAKFWIPSPQVFSAMGFNWNNVKVVPDGSLTCMSGVPIDGTLLKEFSTAPVYVMKNGKKCWISSPQVFNRLGFNWGDVRVVPDGGLSAIPDGPTLT